MAECTACSGNTGPTQSGGSDNSQSASDIASNLAEASTGPNGLEADRFAAHVDAAMDAARAGLHPGINPADIEAAAMAQLGPRDQGQFQQAMEAYSASSTPTALQDIALNAPFALAYTDRFNAVGINAQGQPINSCGHVVPEQTYASSTTTPEYQYAMQRREQARIAMENIDRIRGGPVSGPATTIAMMFGADQRTIELVHGLGLVGDGLTAPLGPSPWEAMRP